MGLSHIPPEAILIAADLVKQFEGCRLDSYRDLGGVWTIGYGCTDGVTGGMSVSQEDADIMLADALEEKAGGVDNLLTVDLTANQAAALISFSYNVGLGNLKSSTLLRLVNAGTFADVPKQFLRWSNVNGQMVRGLLRRRQAEADLWSANA